MQNGLSREVRYSSASSEPACTLHEAAQLTASLPPAPAQDAWGRGWVEAGGGLRRRSEFQPGLEGTGEEEQGPWSCEGTRAGRPMRRPKAVAEWRVPRVRVTHLLEAARPGWPYRQNDNPRAPARRRPMALHASSAYGARGGGGYPFCLLGLVLGLP